MMNDFIHLHVSSEFSLLNGAARIKDLALQASQLGMSALALTDRGVMYGAIPFYKACVQHHIKPIIGCTMAITTGALTDKGLRKEVPVYRLTLLAKNLRGYQNLMALCSVSHLRGFHHQPTIDMAHLTTYAEGLICLSSGLEGELAHYVLSEKWDLAKQTAERYKQLFGEDFYLEIQDHGLLEQKKVINGMVRLHEETGIPLVATNDVHYVRPEDHMMQDVLLCIGTGKIIDDKERMKMPTNQYYLKSGEDMSHLFNHLPEAIRNTARIADKCHLQLDFGQAVLPKYEPLPTSLTASQYLETLCEQGLLQRYEKSAQWTDAAFRNEVRERLAYELSVIESMGFSDYFLIVWDFIRFAHEQRIRVGPGRGSSAGSLVAYVLRITDVDPIRYRLFFERFLNPERISMPDIDIDFNDERRDEVIHYVVNKYGADRVAQIITFGTMAARAAIRDVGRVLNLPYHEVDKAAKMIPNRLGITINEALETNPSLQEFTRRNKQHAEFIEMAIKVEGYPRHASTHAAGIVISHEPLTHYVPLQAGTDNAALTQYAMDELESIGLLKMDFLGLRTLSIIERALKWIEEHEGIALDFTQLSDQDERTYEMLGRGDTSGIFQLESAGVRRVLRELRPTKFEDIISVVALYRPGPMDFIPQYIQGKHGHINVSYPHPSLEAILSDTYGIIVYQEQIMQIASLMAGFSLGEADLLRRAVSKKESAVLNKERDHFVSGSLKQGHTEDEANKVYDMIVRFANYGFPRAHAAAYGVLAYQTAYLKANYPVYFMASMLTAVKGNQQKVAEYVDECRRMSIPVLPPDVNESGILFEPVSPKKSGERYGAIRFGMSGIKNVGTIAMQSMIEQRAVAPFESLVDVCRRIDLKVCNKRVLESLIQGGAMDALPGHRAQKLAMLDETMEAALKWRKEREDLQITLFGLSERINWTITYPDVQPFTMLQQLQQERELLGLYISGHPLDTYVQQIEEHNLDGLHFLSDLRDESLVQVAGMVLSIRMIVTKKGKRMAFVELEDRITKVEVVIFPNTWEQCQSWLEQGSLIFLRARLQHEEDMVKLLAQQLFPLDQAIEQHILKSRPQIKTVPSVTKTKQALPTVYIKITLEHEEDKLLKEVKHTLLNHRGLYRVILHYERDGRSLALSDKYKIAPTSDLIESIEALLGQGAIIVK